MVRRITTAIVAVVLVSLVVAGGGALLLDGRAERSDERVRLDDDARALAGPVAFFVKNAPAGMPAVRRGLARDGAVALTLAEVANDPTLLPKGVVLDDTDLAVLRGAGSVSKQNGSLLIAAAPVPRSTPPQIVVVTRDVPLIAERSGRRFVIASAVGALAAVVTAIWMARRLVRPLRAVQDATRPIAEGALAARADVPISG